MNAIFKRRAVREYANEKIDEEKIQKLIDAFQAAPNWSYGAECNYRPRTS